MTFLSSDNVSALAALASSNPRPNIRGSPANFAHYGVFSAAGPALTRASDDFYPGEKLDNYEIEKVAARSGMATIYRAKDVRTGVPVALKIPQAEAEADPLLFDRFRREEEIGKKLDHPSVMKVYEHEETAASLSMVLKWVDGRLLRQIFFEQKKFPTERAVQITRCSRRSRSIFTATASCTVTWGLKTSWSTSNT